MSTGGLEGIGLFSGLPPEVMREIESLCRWHRFAAEDEVFDKDATSLDVYFVVQGAVRIMHQLEGEREVTFANISAGNYFGELAAIDGRERSARVVAAADSVLASLERKAFIDLMMRHPVVAVRMMERFVRIIRTLDSRVSDLSALSEVQRVYGELIRLAQPDPRRPGGWYIPDLPNHKEIASWAGTARESVAQAIGELARQGIAERRSMNIIVHDWARLQQMARAGTER